MNRSTRGNETGAALILALIALLLITLLGLSLTFNGIVESAMSSNYETGTQAFYVAEAGLMHALAIVQKSNDFNAILAGADGNPLTEGDNGILYGSHLPSGYTAIPAGGLNFGNGRYTVRVLDDEALVSGLSGSNPLREDGNLAVDLNNRVLLLATGLGPKNSTSTIEAILGPLNVPAVLTEDDLTIGGNPNINGSNGSVHTNSDFVISGNPTTTGSATASGSYTASGSPNIGGASGGNRPAFDIPDISPDDYRSSADYIFKADGTVTTGSGVFLFDTSGGTEWNGWKRSSSSPVVWTLSGNTTIDGTFYVEGSVVISGNPGTPGNPGLGTPPIPANVTILARDSIEISGNPILAPDTPDILFIAGRDIKINGNVSQHYRGLIYAGEQISISGNPHLRSNIIAKDRSNDSTLVDQNSISGNPHITFNGSSIRFVGLISWREIRN